MTSSSSTPDISVIYKGGSTVRISIPFVENVKGVAHHGNEMTSVPAFLNGKRFYRSPPDTSWNSPLQTIVISDTGTYDVYVWHAFGNFKYPDLDKTNSGWFEKKDTGLKWGGVSAKLYSRNVKGPVTLNVGTTYRDGQSVAGVVVNQISAPQTPTSTPTSTPIPTPTPTLCLPSGLKHRFNADSWKDERTWEDAIEGGENAEHRGGRSIKINKEKFIRSNGTNSIPKEKGFHYIEGDRNAKWRFPPKLSGTSWTVAFVTRWTPESGITGRILDGRHHGTVMGHDMGVHGVCQQNGQWIGDQTEEPGISDNNREWVLQIVQNGEFWAKSVSTEWIHEGNNVVIEELIDGEQLTINDGIKRHGWTGSDWNMADLMFWDKRLINEEIEQLKAYLETTFLQEGGPSPLTPICVDVSSPTPTPTPPPTPTPTPAPTPTFKDYIPYIAAAGGFLGVLIVTAILYVLWQRRKQMPRLVQLRKQMPRLVPLRKQMPD